MFVDVEHGFCVSVGFDGGFCVNVGVYAFSLVSDARCVLFQFCLRCVDVDFGCEYCSPGLTLNVDLVNVGFEFELCSLFWRAEV